MPKYDQFIFIGFSFHDNGEFKRRDSSIYPKHDSIGLDKPQERNSFISSGCIYGPQLWDGDKYT
jgi:hypothetical protein